MNNKFFVSIVVGALLISGIVFSINQVRGKAASSSASAPIVPVTGGSTGWRDSGVNTRDGAPNPAGVTVSGYRDAGAITTNNLSGSSIQGNRNVSVPVQTTDGYLDAGASRLRKHAGGR